MGEARLASGEALRRPEGPGFRGCSSGCEAHESASADLPRGIARLQAREVQEVEIRAFE